MKRYKAASIFTCACLASGMLALPVSAKHISGNDFKVEKNDILTIDNLKRIVTDVKEDGSYTAIPLGDWFEEQNNCLRRTLFDRYTNTVNFYGVGLNGVTLEELVGGTPEENAALVKEILEGKVTGAKLDAVLINAGAAIHVAKNVSMEEGIKEAREMITSGKALATMEQFIAETNAA